ncbi:hypothetical protein GCM10011360_22840 [Primorskyibacter flagellatus]|uniref:Uncharacterized protein n=1 Tax=Primorskyibacter flagellatus TaxID=1387277 RepID=A0A917A8L8_9RHOB|nr:hypothetical protein [Primorskyibacter flagellatus]GGE34402.1 hypothetical protein GCM10011360_22840 [Primorskyibacter flagellatus]
MHRLLSFDEARQCGRAFQRVKLSFVPGVDLAAYDALSPEAKAAANLTGYQRYVGWSELNAAKLDLLRDRVRAVRALAAD